MARITKIELLQSNERLMAENSALRAENSTLRAHNASLRLDVEDLRTQSSAPSTQPSAPSAQPEAPKRPKLVFDSNWTLAQLAQHFAKHYHCSTKIADGAVFYKTKQMASWKQVNVH